MDINIGQKKRDHILSSFNKAEDYSTSIMPGVARDYSKLLARLRQRRDPEGIEKSYADVLIVNQEGKLLLLKRSKQDTFGPQMWCLPGGTIDEGEVASQTAIRELEEETSIKINPSAIQQVAEIANNPGYTTYFFASLPPNATVTIHTLEHDSFMWVDRDTLLQLPLLLDLKERLIKLLTAWFVS